MDQNLGETQSPKPQKYYRVIIIGYHWIGIIIDDQLKWNEWNNEQCKTISKGVALLRNAKDFVSQEELVTMINSCVLPNFNYCSTVWHGNNNSYTNDLFRLQKRNVRIITNSDFSIRSTKIFETLQWHLIKTTLDKRELIMMFNVLKGVSQDY